MRDIGRITPFCGKLANAWMNFPNWRFGQFIMNFFSWCGRDPFYLEDKELEELLIRYVEKMQE